MKGEKEIEIQSDVRGRRSHTIWARMGGAGLDGPDEYVNDMYIARSCVNYYILYIFVVCHSFCCISFISVVWQPMEV